MRGPVELPVLLLTFFAAGGPDAREARAAGSPVAGQGAEQELAVSVGTVEDVQGGQVVVRVGRDETLRVQTDSNTVVHMAGAAPLVRELRAGQYVRVLWQRRPGEQRAHRIDVLAPAPD